jgi:hypothetical protein
VSTGLNMPDDVPDHVPDDVPVDAAGDPAEGQGRKVPALQGKVRVPEVGVSGILPDTPTSS